jgi:hypothetical protein
MKSCIKCQSNVSVIDSRKTAIVKGISCLVRRRYECSVCGERYTTYEIPQIELDRLAAAVEVVYKTVPELIRRIRSFTGEGQSGPTPVGADAEQQQATRDDEPAPLNSGR